MTGKVVEANPPETLWPHLEALGVRDSAGAVIATAGARLAGIADRADAEPTLTANQLTVVNQIEEVARRDGARETYEYLLHRWQQANARQISFTPEPLARLMAELADTVGGPAGVIHTVLDPACGTGGLLTAAFERWGDSVRQRAANRKTQLLGQDIDPVLASLAAARLTLRKAVNPAETCRLDKASPSIRVGDTLRADGHPADRVDVILSNPPFNTRNWGYEELATDRQWVYGLPPRSESELAWVQHALARLAPRGIAVLLMPPAVAFRPAGRKIRAALLRAGVIRAIVALPAGCAPPYSLALHLWLLQAPGDNEPATANSELLLVDAATSGADTDQGPLTGGRETVDWAGLRERVLGALRGDGYGWVSVPVIDLLDDRVDLTPARQVPSVAESAALEMRRSWSRLVALLDDLRELSGALVKVESAPESGAGQPLALVGDLVRAGALELLTGRSPAEASVRAGKAPPGAVPVLTVQDVLLGGRPSGWLPGEEAAAAEQAGELTITAAGDVVVVAVSRAFSAWVASQSPIAVGSKIHILRPDSSLVDSWFLAGCLRAPSNVRRAGTHSSASARVDVRRLQVLSLPLEEQRRYGDAARLLARFAESLHETEDIGSNLVRGLSEFLLAGSLR
ncbi:N-6 DNA methylase [Frankia sp. Cj3]|uniref:N-6 DNA methylase n=1 Tax=Frankia sp. Cj3 TaxID=2880976 RepID=UPI001EF60349|nr:N-6 DNA methylase [Frankia sp. Cj3]